MPGLVMSSFLLGKNGSERRFVMFRSPAPSVS